MGSWTSLGLLTSLCPGCGKQLHHAARLRDMPLESGFNLTCCGCQLSKRMHPSHTVNVILPTATGNNISSSTAELHKLIRDTMPLGDTPVWSTCPIARFQEVLAIFGAPYECDMCVLLPIPSIIWLSSAVGVAPAQLSQMKIVMLTLSTCRACFFVRTHSAKLSPPCTCAQGTYRTPPLGGRYVQSA